MPVAKAWKGPAFVTKQCVKINFMKHLLYLFIYLFISSNSFGQDNRHLKQQIEKYIPYYVIENYCSKTGLDNIVKFAKTDDRVFAVKQLEGRVLSDYSVFIRYNNSVLEFDKYEGVPYLGIFKVYFPTKIDMDNFISFFLKIMDPEEVHFGWGLTNNVIPNNGDSELIGGAPYMATCFVNQWDYCGK